MSMIEKKTIHLLQIIRNVIPVSNPFPLRTFPSRTIRKWIYLIKEFFLWVGWILKVRGSDFVGFTESGNALLQLRKIGSLGYAGKVLELPKDQVIYKSVRLSATWEREVAIFLSAEISMQEAKIKKPVLFLDIGANVGLIALQVLNQTNSLMEAFLIEPIESHCSAIVSNLVEYKNRIQVFRFALGSFDGSSTIYTQRSNRGNSSLVEGAMHNTIFDESVIEVVNTKNFITGIIDNYQFVVIKCDTQGQDARILARLGEDFWSKVNAVAVEIWAIEEVEPDDVALVTKNMGEFSCLRWDNSDICGLRPDEIMDFWLNKSGRSSNLFASRTCRH